MGKFRFILHGNIDFGEAQTYMPYFPNVKIQVAKNLPKLTENDICFQWGNIDSGEPQA